MICLEKETYLQVRSLLVDADSILSLIAHRGLTEENRDEAREVYVRCRAAYQKLDRLFGKFEPQHDKQRPLL